MTLERHRSHLIPNVQYSLDGTLFVTDTGGTFPLRGKGKQHKDVRQQVYQSPEPAPSYLSYDPRRDSERRRRYKQRPSPNRFGDEVANISGHSTISTNTSTLLRKLRRSKRQYSSVRGKEYRYTGGGDKDNRHYDNFRFNENGYNSVSGGSTGRRLRAGPPRMTPEFAESLREKKAARSLDMEAARRENPYHTNRRSSGSENNNTLKRTKSKRNSNGSIKPIGLYEKERYRKIHDEKLPYVVFLIDGVFLMVVGIVRIVMSYWHENFCPLWSGLLAIMLGVIGAKHGGLYLAKGINVAYIFFGFLVSIAMLMSSGFVLMVLVPLLTSMAGESMPPDVVISQVTYTNMNRTLSQLEISPTAMIWTSVALDLSTILFLFVGYFSVTASMIALSNHWDASYDTTADCDHRGNPRLFNPIEQAALGEATVFMGLLYISANSGFSNVNNDHFYMPVVSGALVMISGVLSFCFGKRTDMLAMGTFACIFEVLSFAAICGATVLVILGIVRDVTSLQNSDIQVQEYKERLGISIIGGALAFVLAVNIVFIIGTMFRQFREVCCRKCCKQKPDDVQHYGTHEKKKRNYDSLERSIRR